MNLADLKDGQEVEARFARGDVYDEQQGMHVPNWGQWRRVNLYLRRREQPLPAKLKGRARGHDKVGDIIELTPRGMEWASYTQADFDPATGIFTAEEWMMQIKGLT